MILSMNPSPIASPIPSSRPAATPLQSALATQAGALTHVTDKLEFSFLAGENPSAQTLSQAISALHSVTDALNSLYETAGNTQLDLDSLNRRLKWAQVSAEKHHNGDIAACERANAATERAEAFRAVLLRLVDSPDLHLENMEPRTYAAIEDAKDLLYPN